MQDINSIESSTGGGGQLFAGERDIQFRPQHHDLQCPRCDSFNTKFCYYNNYNLSQPRHFCKSCRRYWTKGGVLRNVPVGGGIRKTKRSGKLKSKPNIIPSTDAVPVNRKTSNSDNSSSDSSRTTATAIATPTTVTEVSTGNSTNSTPVMLLKFKESSSTRFLNFNQFSTPILTFDSLMLNQSLVSNMSPEFGTFTSTKTSSTDWLPQEFNTTAGVPSFQLQLHQQNQLHWMEDDVKMPEIMRSSMLSEQTAEIDYTGVGRRRSDGGFAGGDDWQDSGDVDQSYWCQSQWNDDHQSSSP